MKTNLLLLIIVCAGHTIFAQPSSNKALLGEWHLKLMVSKGDTVYDSDKKDALENWYIKTVLSHDDPAEKDTIKETKQAMLSTVEEMFKAVKMTFKENGKMSGTVMSYEPEAVTGSYTIEKNGKVKLKYDKDGTIVEGNLINGNLFSSRLVESEDVYYFSKDTKKKK